MILCFCFIPCAVGAIGYYRAKTKQRAMNVINTNLLKNIFRIVVWRCPVFSWFWAVLQIIFFHTVSCRIVLRPITNATFEHFKKLYSTTFDRDGRHRRRTVTNARALTYTPSRYHYFCYSSLLCRTPQRSFRTHTRTRNRLSPQRKCTAFTVRWHILRAIKR